MQSDGTHESGSQCVAPRKIYAVPRRYDLATLFAVSLAFALLFGGLRLIDLKPIGFAVVASFITFVGLAQALLFRGNAPRLASVLAGVTYWIVGAVVSVIMIAFAQARLMTFHGLGVAAMILLAAAIPSAVIGSLLGYLTGVLIGGVFLVADFTRRNVKRFSGP